MGVVRLVRVGEDPVGERGVGGSRSQAGADDGGCALSAVRLHITQRRLSGRQFCSGDHRPQGVDDVVLCVLDDLGRQGAFAGTRHIRTEPAHHWARRLRERTRPRRHEAEHRHSANTDNPASVHLKKDDKIAAPHVISLPSRGP